MPASYVKVSDKLFKITPIPAFKDNYIWAIHSPDNCSFTVVDPGDAAPVISYSANNGLVLDSILITHHHADHTGGILALTEHFKKISVFGPKHDDVLGLTCLLEEGDRVSLFQGALSLKVLDIPGHTKGHIAYYGPSIVFTGDTLFSCGCGRLFEGTPQQMFHSLNKLKQLPDETEIFCGHEYTLANIAFAKQLEPHNIALQTRYNDVFAKRSRSETSLPCNLKIERQTNPFLRCEEPTIIHAVQQQCSTTAHSPVEIFTLLRKWKDHFVHQE